MRNQNRHRSIHVAAGILALAVWSNVEPGIAAAAASDIGQITNPGGMLCGRVADLSLVTVGPPRLGNTLDTGTSIVYRSANALAVTVLYEWTASGWQVKATSPTFLIHVDAVLQTPNEYYKWVGGSWVRAALAAGYLGGLTPVSINVEVTRGRSYAALNFVQWLDSSFQPASNWISVAVNNDPDTTKVCVAP